ncbi:hypothetical protein [Nonomuraea angiospora]|uniref:hypothetical protein n=1 Tax=Nonomuraea angiospora TaxID=46172 RepID=UPI0029A6B03C|nr:hypothetical protein [Nonomuraea angiospora]MDX3103315.1 hypothetical protein [Nonomuraea angiospora]
MARTRATAASAVVLALGLAGVGATPFIVQSASASVSAYQPVDPCDVGETCDTTPETTVTVTETAGTPEPEEPETTITKTVTSTPTKASKTPKPTKSTTPPATTSAPATQQNPQPLPTQTVEQLPVSTPTETTSESIDIPEVASSDPVTPPSTQPSDTQPASSEEVPLELRNAAPEFDQKSLTQKLSIPALVLVLLALFAVLIFEGRLRRMAHAAAVRKAGPQPGRPDLPPPPPGGGYPAGPGYYTTAGFPAPGYPGGTAYAPIISFVPVQTYPSGPVPGYEEHHYPPQTYPQEAPSPPAAAEPVVLHPDEFDSFNHEPPKPKEFRDPFEPLVPADPPPSDIPPGGADPYEVPGQERPLGAVSAVETGDSEPWQGGGRSLFDPPARNQEQQAYDPPPYLAPDAEATVVQPLPPEPGQPEQTKELPDPKRRRWGRKK